jgi:hypothetical protein
VKLSSNSRRWWGRKFEGVWGYYFDTWGQSIIASRIQVCADYMQLQYRVRTIINVLLNT